MIDEYEDECMPVMMVSVFSYMTAVLRYIVDHQFPQALLISLVCSQQLCLPFYGGKLSSDLTSFIRLKYSHKKGTDCPKTGKMIDWNIVIYVIFHP